MKFTAHILIVFLGITLSMASPQANAKESQTYFDENAKYSETITLPEEYLGFELGQWHISPEALTGYVNLVAKQSPRAATKIIGYSHERKAISHLYISSPENIANLDDVLEKHISAKSARDDILVVNLAYSIHGNEASGSNAAPLVAYYLAASEDEWVKDYLEKTVVIIEPVQNPDGLARFASWANQHKGVTRNFDPQNRDHYEAWPSGRTNHYWFDLNRDWIFTVHPESKARLKAYHEWRPHVLGDYHEMGGNISSYFFQPGHPNRTHPLTSKANQKITLGLAKYHAAALDARSQPYYTEERFDDFYYGKGSAYPDSTGAIGLLFEQSTVRGHAKELGGEEVEFSDAIANQVATSLSLIKGTDAYRDEILEYRFAHERQQNEAAKNNPVKGYVFSDDGDPIRGRMLLEILERHNIDVFELTSDATIAKQKFAKNQAWLVKTGGPQNALIHSLFETRTEFDDNVFYDISTWNLPLAFNLPYAPTRTFRGLDVKPLTVLAPRTPASDIPQNPVAYAFEWNQYRAPHLLQALMADELHPRLAMKPFSADVQNGEVQTFDSGTIILQPRTEEDHAKVRRNLQMHPSVVTIGLSSGLTPSGPDLGSRGMKVLKPVKPALLVGEGVRTTEAGEIRYTVDSRFGMPLTLLSLNRLGKTKLSEYTHLLLAGGSYGAWDDLPKDLKDWVKEGGILVAQKEAAIWAEEEIIFKSEDEDDKKDGDKDKSEDEEETVRRAYQDYEQDRGRQTITGVAVWADADLTHPLMFGFNRNRIPIFYNATKTLAEPPISYDAPLTYAKKDFVISGYADESRREEIRNSPALAIHRMGDGKIILLSHVSNFRATWLGTERLYANALFFTQAIEDRKDPEEKDKKGR